MSHFGPVQEQWLPAYLAAASLGITIEDVIKLAGAHRRGRQKQNGGWVYNLDFLRRKRDRNP